MSKTYETDVLREWLKSARYWERHAPLIRKIFAPVTSALIQEAGIVAGHRVLDVAGGPGEPSLTIAEAVRPAGAVTCTDAIADMVRAAKREAHRRAITNVGFCQCAGDTLPFADKVFDSVVSRLGLMFFPDPLSGVREMLRVMRPGGNLGLVVWGKSDLNPFSYIVTDITSRFVKTPPADPDAPGAFRFGEPGKLAHLVQAAGAINVSERLLQFQIEAPISRSEFWNLRAETSGSLRENLTKLSPRERMLVAQEVQQAMRAFCTNDGISLPAQMLIVTANRQ
jgi:ubiquinone/menaquinone biosynthesis C-methylase UbiE